MEPQLLNKLVRQVPASENFPLKSNHQTNKMYCLWKDQIE